MAPKYLNIFKNLLNSAENMHDLFDDFIKQIQKYSKNTWKCVNKKLKGQILHQAAHVMGSTNLMPKIRWFFYMNIK